MASVGGQHCWMSLETEDLVVGLTQDYALVTVAHSVNG